MEIIKQSYSWSRALQARSSTEYGIIHHEAGQGMDAQQIHKMHRDVNGWPGIGYHFYVRLDGSVYEGRPINTVGTHTANHNSASIGICFEGNFETRTVLPTKQYQSGVELIAYLMKQYPNLKWRRHKDLNATACPGKYFPFEEMIEEAEVMALTGEQIAKKLESYYEEKYKTSDKTWAEPMVNEAKQLGLSDGSRLFEPIPCYRVIALMLKAYKRGKEK